MYGITNKEIERHRNHVTFKVNIPAGHGDACVTAKVSGDVEKRDRKSRVIQCLYSMFEVTLDKV